MKASEKKSNRADRKYVASVISLNKKHYTYKPLYYSNVEFKAYKKSSKYVKDLI